MKLITGAVTDVGRVRNGNEDAFIVDERIGLYAVADGMGGHQAGEVASATALESLRALVATGTAIGNALEAANAAVFEKAKARPDLRGMGTTVTAGSLINDALVIAHVGDSRAYLLRDGEMTQITKDHSLVEELVREGRLTEEEATTHPQRSIITRALGIDADVDIDVITIELQIGDRILLCSDGLTTMVHATDIAAILRREADPLRAATALVDTANAAGGDDNITTVVADVIAGPDGVAADATQSFANTESETDQVARIEHPSPADITTPPLPQDATAARAAEASATPQTRRDRRNARTSGGFLHAARRITLYVLPILVLLGIAIGATGWYARNSYFVGFAGTDVIVYRGVPGGLLGWNPTREETAKLRRSDLTRAEQDDLADGRRFSSSNKAHLFIARLIEKYKQPSPSTTPTPTTSSTEPGPTSETSTTSAPTTSTPGLPTTLAPPAPGSGPPFP